MLIMNIAKSSKLQENLVEAVSSVWKHIMNLKTCRKPDFAHI